MLHFGVHFTKSLPKVPPRLAKGHCGSSGRAACPVFRRLSTRQLSRQTSLAGLQNAGKWCPRSTICCSTAACWHDDTQRTPAAKSTPYAKRSVTKPHLSKLIQAHMQRKNVPSYLDEFKSETSETNFLFFVGLSKIGSPIPSKCAYSKPKNVAKTYRK